MNLTPLTPLTKIYVCSGVPLDSTYKDTLTFGNRNQQADYFAGKNKFALTYNTPIRLQNQIRLPINADKLYDCNYIMWQNTNFGDKWFYAFIKQIDFININMSNITVEIDVMQTWYFDYTVKPSFIEREHTNNDTIGNNLVEEGLELGEYVRTGNTALAELDTLFIVIVTSFKITGTETEVATSVRGRIFGGCHYYAFSLDSGGLANATSFLDSVTKLGKSDGIIGIIMYPYTLIAPENSFDGAPLKEFAIVKNYSTLDGYTPKNKKLYTYPYNFLYVTNNQGNSANFMYEFFSGNECVFKYGADTTLNPSVLLFPVDYKNCHFNFDEKLLLTNFPLCSYNIDAYKAWLAQNSSSLSTSVLSSAFSSVMGATLNGASGNVGGAVSNAFSGVSSIASTMATISDKSKMPPQSHGSQNSSTNTAHGLQNFIFTNKNITSQFAKRIDDFFSMFGYATHETKVPNITGRPSWNYVKTLESKIVGKIPFEDIEKIRGIFDKGVTFWHGDWVGDYNRGNQL